MWIKQFYTQIHSKIIIHIHNRPIYTANRVGQKLSTFAQRWVKYQQPKLFGQFDPMKGKT